jgi:hypothetical protein
MRPATVPNAMIAASGAPTLRTGRGIGGTAKKATPGPENTPEA